MESCENLKASQYIDNLILVQSYLEFEEDEWSKNPFFFCQKK